VAVVDEPEQEVFGFTAVGLIEAGDPAGDRRGVARGQVAGGESLGDLWQAGELGGRVARSLARAWRIPRDVRSHAVGEVCPHSAICPVRAATWTRAAMAASSRSTARPRVSACS
jgi:hypothetical protein